MALWVFFFILVGCSFRFWVIEFNRICAAFGLVQKSDEVRNVINLLEEFQGLLESGVVPSPESWSLLKTLPSPWGPLLSQSIEELRQAGAQVLPTLRRFKNLAVDQRESLKKAKARAAQSLAQALICFGLVPVFGSLLYALLPGLEKNFSVWLMACVLSASVSGLGAIWMIKQSEWARWGGLPYSKRNSVLTAQIGGERLIALLRGGEPADLAWVKAIQWIENHSSELASEWGHSVWSTETVTKKHSDFPVCLIEAGRDLKHSVWVSVMEGRSCLERIESAIFSLSSGWTAQVEREIALLATRSLKPLFFTVAPSLLGLMAFGLWLSWKEQGGFGV